MAINNEYTSAYYFNYIKYCPTIRCCRFVGWGIAKSKIIKQKYEMSLTSRKCNELTSFHEINKAHPMHKPPLFQSILSKRKVNPRFQNTQPPPFSADVYTPGYSCCICVFQKIRFGNIYSRHKINTLTQ